MKHFFAPMACSGRLLTVRFIVSKFFLLYLFFAVACSCGNEDSIGRIYIPTQTSSLMLEFKSEADQKNIPVYIAFPPSPKIPLKAVVILHGSGGAWNDKDSNGDGIGDICNVGELSSQNKKWESLLLGQGYAVAFPDSYSTRGTCENEGDYKSPPLKFRISATFIRNRDAQGTLELLQRLTWDNSSTPIIDINNVAIVGFSDGGSAVISTVFDASTLPTNWIWKQSFDGVEYTREILSPLKKNDLTFKAAVAYYPGSYHNGYYGNLCNNTGVYRSYCDVVFHLPDEDPLSKNSECLIATMNSLSGGSPLVYHYENTDHGFDSDNSIESSLAQSRTILHINTKLNQ